MSGWVKVPIHGGATYVDFADWDLATSRRWHVNDSGYAVWRSKVDGVKKTIRLHRLIARTPDELVTDHINHNTLDNRRSNLRVCTQSENMRNLTNQGKGYWYQRQNRNWVVEVNGRHIGCFPTEEEAAKIVALVRSGGRYVKPVRTHCKYGHSLEDAYRYGKTVLCKPCLKRRQHEYLKRKGASKLSQVTVSAG